MVNSVVISGCFKGIEDGKSSNCQNKYFKMVSKRIK